VAYGGFFNTISLYYYVWCGRFLCLLCPEWSRRNALGVRTLILKLAASLGLSKLFLVYSCLFSVYSCLFCIYLSPKFRTHYPVKSSQILPTDNIRRPSLAKQSADGCFLVKPDLKDQMPARLKHVFNTRGNSTVGG